MSRSVLALLVGFGLTAQVIAQTPEAKAATVDHSILDSILRARVKAERVDYLGIRKHDSAQLGRYLDAMAKVDTKTLTEPQRLAYYINLYNAAMIAAIVDRLVEGFSPAADDFSIFKAALVRLEGRRVSLNSLENEIIRKQFAEPRIHVALVCGAVSCPPLLPRAYRAGDLDRVLQQNMRRFLADHSRNRIDVANRSLKLSAIFNWYKADFGGDKGLLSYVDRHTRPAVKGFTVEHMAYVWDLNMQRPDDSWVSLRQAAPGLARGAYLELVEATGRRVRVRAADGKLHTIERAKLKFFGRPTSRPRR